MINFLICLSNIDINSYTYKKNTICKKHKLVFKKTMFSKHILKYFNKKTAGFKSINFKTRLVPCRKLNKFQKSDLL